MEQEYNMYHFQKELMTTDIGEFYPTNFQSFDPNIFYQPQNFEYTPSYGSPQSSFQESIGSSPSLSDYEPSSDGYISSCVSSPSLSAEQAYLENRRNSFEYISEETPQLYSQETMAQFQQYNDLSVEPVGSLKLDTNISSNNEHNTATDSFLNGGTFDTLSPNTFAQCLSTEPQPLFNFVPATPLTPTKAAAIADNFYPYTLHDDQLPTMAITNSQIDIMEQEVHLAEVQHVQSQQQQQVQQEPQVKNKAANRKSDSSLLRGRTHSTIHRGHRKSLPSDMAERLHTMNLAPPKPARKSKTAAPFACPYEDCPKTFTRQYNLKSHLRTHTDERPFLCGYQGCTRAFARQHDRKRHFNLHLGFKPHVCGHCGRAFARLDALNRHLRSDSGAPCAQATLPNAGAKKFKPVNM